MMLKREQAYVAGEWIDGSDWIQVTNPATCETVGRVPALGANETRRAIKAADQAQPAWAAKTAKERAGVLRRWFELMTEHADALAELMTTEQGKPLAEARGEVAYAASFAEWFAEEAKRVYGHTVPAHKTDARIVVQQQPVGVVGAITPWNFPLAMITRKAAPALAAGCAVVIKPSELTPFSALAMMVLAEAAWVPPGLMSVVTGYPTEIGS